MSSLLKLRNLHLLKRVSILCPQPYFKSSEFHLYLNAPHPISRFIRLSSAERGVKFEIGENLRDLAKKSLDARQQAQAALLEYFHCTRNLKFTDAENMAKNAPEFLDRLLQRVEIVDDDDGRGGGGDVGRSLARFLRYHPVNEFEPFFESIGLKPSEYATFLPRNLMFLNDDQFLLQSYYVLCNYGIARNKIGKIYKQVRELFWHDCGILQLKLRYFESLGLNQFLVVKIIASSPYLLRGDSNKEFLEFLANLKNTGIKYDWLGEHMREGDSYCWICMLELMCLLGKLGLSAEKLGEVITCHPDLLLEGSGRVAFCLLGFLLKFGCTQNDLRTVFLKFPDISVVKFMNNLVRCYKLLVNIKMPAEDIGRLFCSYPLMLGLCEVKKYNSMRCELNCGRERLRRMVKDDPTVLKTWVLGVRVKRPPEQKRVLNVKMLKTKFLLSLGFVEKSKEMDRALKAMRGKAAELQERFEYLVNAGLNREDVIMMVTVCPEIINQSKDAIEEKIGCFVRDLGYPLSDLLTHPRLLSYAVERVKLRLLMYKWLKDEGAVNPKMALSSLFRCSEKTFLRYYVNSHSKGSEFWERLKEEIYSD